MEKNIEKYYSIFVGGREPKTIDVGFLDKNTGNPKGLTSKATISVGAISIPNYSNVWGKLKEDKGKLTGDIEFMKWGRAGGEVIEIRFLKSTKSLSKLYQDNIIKLKPREDECEINLVNGVNNFDYKTDSTLIEMLKHHSLNETNESRNPSISETMFKEHSSSSRVAAKTAAIEERTRANSVVTDSKDDRAVLVILAAIFDLDAKAQDDYIVELLLEKSEEDPKLFLQILSDAREKAKSILEKADEYELLDAITIPSEIILINSRGKKEKLITSIPKENAKNKFQWVSENYINPEIYDAIEKLSKVVKDYEVNKFN